MTNSNNRKQKQRLLLLKIAFILALVAVVGYIDGNTRQIENDYCESSNDWTFCAYR